MNPDLQTILDFISQSEHLTAEEKGLLSKAAKNADKDLERTVFKLERTEKVKKTTGILLEETIAELDQKRKAVEEQNRELEIESALEKVRSTSLALHHSDELEKVVTVLFQKLTELKLSFSGAGIFVFDEKERNIQHWIKGLGVSTGKNNLPYDTGFAENTIVKDLWCAKENGSHILNKTYSKEEKDEFFLYIGKYNDGTKVPDDVKEYIHNAETFTMSVAAERHSLIGLDNWHGLVTSEEDFQVLKRFARVFDQAYVRFLDLQKAEAQAREAQIEAALERIRSRSLGMYKTDDLRDVVTVLFEQMQGLSVDMGFASVSIFIFGEGTRNIHQWLPLTDGVASLSVPYFEHPISSDIFDARENGADFFAKVYTVEEKNTWVEKGFVLTDYKDLPEDFKTSLLEAPGYAISITLAKNSGICIPSFTGRLPSTGDVEIMKRVGKVFEQAYIRFLDLQKAEAQAREAQIEAALEKVRSRSLAMHRSDELGQVVATLFDRLVELGLSFDGVLIFVFEKGKRDIHLWIATNQLPAPELINLPYDEDIKDNAIINDIWNAIEKGEHIFNRSYSGETKNDYFRYVAKHNESKVPEPVRKIQLEADRWTAYYAVEKNSMVGFDSWSGHIITGQDFQTLIRFAKVFEQAYTRFLDLQKAEAQAREARIEAALEKVRSRTMAMQHSEELSKTASEMFKQIQSLGMQPWACGFNIFDKDEKTVTQWMSLADGGISPPFRTPLTEDPFFISIYDARQRKEELLVMESSGKELEDTYHYMFSLPDSGKIFGDIEKSGFPMPKFQITHCAYFSQGYLVFITYEPVPESWDIFKRFARVFEQTYTRFLDLQKAETQAREAQIETALEKVRAHTMGMQSSKDLSNVASVMFNQMKNLGGELFSFAIVLCDKQKNIVEQWHNIGNEGMISSFFVPVDLDYIHRYRYDQWKAGAELFSIEISGDYIVRHFELMFELPSVQAAMAEASSQGIQVAIPAWEIDYGASFRHGYLLISSFKPFKEDHIFPRFAKVFDQAYTRFLDLQKAEAQAREAQIEAALERVRSRSMGMQKSEELGEVSQVLNEQLQHLNFRNYIAGFLMDYQASDDFEIWRSDPIRLMLNKTHVPYFDHPIFSEFIRSKKERLDFNTLSLTFEEKNKWLDYAIPYFPPLPREIIDALYNGAGYAVSVAYMKNVGVYIENFEGIPFSDEENSTLRRFAKVFEQTYTRFLDLQKAETQAREAKIEAALEKVRSRSLAMHKSDEIEDVLHTLFERFKELDVEFYTVIIILFEKGTKDIVWWLESRENKLYPKTLIPYGPVSYLRDLFDARENGPDHFSKLYSFEEKNELFHHLFDHTDFKNVSEQQKKFLLETESYSMSVALAKNTAIHITRYSGKPFSEQDNEILKRFARVFEQAYTRFLDLQKAETQAREAKIEAALERTRTQSMLMQHSNELDNTLRVFHEQVLLLGIPSAFSFLWLPDEDRDRHIFWAAWVETVSIDPLAEKESVVFKSKAINYPLDRDEPATAQCIVDWKSKLPFVSYHVSPDGVKDYFTAWEELLAGVEQLKPEYYSDGLYYAEAYMKYGCFGVMIKAELQEEEKKILCRFAIEFERTYTRFLDLQKAEAQAREARIEVALEKVRSRTMGMQQSRELGDVATVLFKELNQLVENLWSCGFVLCEKDRGEDEWWLSTGDGFIPAFYLPNTVDPTHANIYDAWKNGESYHTEQLENEALQKHYDWLMGIPVSRKIFEEMLAAGSPLPTWQKLHCAYFSYGYLVMITQVPCAEEQIFKRFAQVFDQTYTRFLDLQKAEAQAREAQIEAALERVRSRAMAMHAADELIEVANVLREQMALLGQPELETIAVHLYKEDSEYFESWYAFRASDKPADKIFTGTAIFKSDSCKVALDFVKEYFSEKKEYTIEVSGAKREEWLNVLSKDAPIVAESFYERFDTAPEKTYFHCTDFSGGSMVMVSYQPPAEESCDLQRRATTVFDLAYRRFLDLQKAESQAREAQIEAALERVRSRSMGMQKSEELKEVIQVVFEQFIHLNINIEHTGFVMDYKLRDDYYIWVADPLGVPSQVTIPYFDCVYYNRFNEAKEKGEDFFATNLSFEEKNKFYQELFEYVPGLPEEALKFYLSCPGLAISTVLLENIVLYIENFLGIPFSEEDNNILMRFGKVFQQTYTRFSDLQKAEAQARESQIEASLERVRSRTMAMHKSDELLDIIIVVSEQLQQLNIKFGNVSFGVNNEKYDLQLWMAVKGFPNAYHIHWTFLDNPGVTRLKDAQQHPENVYTDVLTQAENNEWMQHIFKCNQGLDIFSDEFRSKLLDTRGYARSIVVMKDIFLVMGNYAAIPYTDDENAILKRFANVFEQAYKRFKDLQKAEAQAREAQIEAALERVRAKVMAMNNSKELNDTSLVFGEQLRKLGIDWKFSYFWLIDEQKNENTFWITWPDYKTSLTKYTLAEAEEYFNDCLISWRAGVKMHDNYVPPESVQEWIDTYQRITDDAGGEAKNVMKRDTFPDGVFYYDAMMKYGSFGICIQKPATDEEKNIQCRFAIEFERAYTRFLDLQKAEAQAREAQVEAALEKVRGRAMAMHKSDELLETGALLYNELSKLGVEKLTSGYMLIDEDEKMGWNYGINPANGQLIPRPVGVRLNETKVMKSIIESWKKHEPLHIIQLNPEETIAHQTYMADHTINFPISKEKLLAVTPERLVIHTFNFKHGYLLIVGGLLLTVEQQEMVARFSKVFEMTYRRFLDLKNAEALALEAIKRASVDRVRAEIASMRTTSDLERITPLIWNELSTLGVPFIRCGVFIMDEEKQEVQTMLSTPDGKAIATMHVPFDFDLSIIINGVSYWRKKEIYKEYWDADTFHEVWVRLSSLRETIVDSPQTGHAPENLHLYMLPFLQGMLYVGSESPLNDDALHLVQNLADAFSTAYARYEDFNKLESAKKQVDSTLNELQATQKQLIQSEKMASLGELTAGIAHEIQNPLNFVNNFSELNKELLTELNKGIEEGNLDEVKMIALDLTSNEEKISHHGRRAEAIVKGMLQHSRTGLSEKEATDINKLADEYFRLAYHGLRGKDNSFHAILKTDYDHEIGMVNVVPQDIGRALLNMYNNAFYAVSAKAKELSQMDKDRSATADAVNEKRKTADGLYDPTVSVITEKCGDRVEIKITDNGNGIPQKVIDKIFQPFFTTKPTGQGTGLGLSLAYDIITKGHGGELKAETKEGEGCKFTIILPIT